MEYKYIDNSKYKVTINNQEYIFYEDIIIKNNILNKTIINSKMINSYLKENIYYEAYYKSIKYLKYKQRAKLQISNYLYKQHYSDDIIKKVIIHLEEEGYINEVLFTKSYIHDQILLTNNGPCKIKYNLLKFNITKDTIEKEMEIFDKKIVVNKINKIINIRHKKNQPKTINQINNSLLKYLVNKGYEQNQVIEILSSIKKE